MRKNLLALSLAAAAFAGFSGFAGVPAAPAREYPSPFAATRHSQFGRSRTPSRGQPAGSKLARRARRGRIGLAVIR